jgi:3-methyladenine DNA glycosylase AlkD
LIPEKREAKEELKQISMTLNDNFLKLSKLLGREDTEEELSNECCVDNANGTPHPIVVKHLEDALNNWIKDISKNATKDSLQHHIVKHANEIFEKDPQEWSASMRNLIDIFESICGVEPPSVVLRLKKLEEKYRTDPEKYTGPPQTTGDKE